MNWPIWQTNCFKMLKIGHRGWRGCYPENTMQATEALFKGGFSAVEIDVVVTGDGQLLISHEPWIAADYCLDSKGKSIPREAEKSHNIFEMTAHQIKAYDCGSKCHPSFPLQQRSRQTKPFLQDFLAAFDWMDRHLFLEIKSHPDGDNLFHPSPEEYGAIIEKEMRAFPYLQNVYFMSFDERIIQQLKHNRPNWKVMLLTETADATFDASVTSIWPDAIGVHHPLITPEKVQKWRNDSLQIFAWTVNEWPDINRVQQLGIDGIISDYPNRL